MLANVSTYLDAHFSNDSISGQIVSNINLVQAESENLGSQALRTSQAQEA
jgi:hypothetical protein